MTPAVETQIVWPRLKILWHCEDNSAGNNERSKKDRKAEGKEDNIKEWTGLGFGDSLRAAEYQRKVEMNCCNILVSVSMIFKVIELNWTDITTRKFNTYKNQEAESTLTIKAPSKIYC